MWLKRTEYERLVSLAAQSRFLTDAQKRAENAERALAAERAAKDWLTLQLSSRIVTKHGGYGLEQEAPAKSLPHPQGFTHEPSEIDLAKLEFYKKCAREAGRSEEDAVMRWETEMRGDALPVEYEASEAEQ